MSGLFVKSDSATENHVIKSGRLSINRFTRAVMVSAGYTLFLTDKEFAVLEILMLRKGMVITKEMIMGHLYGGVDEPELKTICVFISKLRKKLAALSGGEEFIDTIRGRGYMMRDIVEISDKVDQSVTHMTAA